jgi:hypothetical protein
LRDAQRRSGAIEGAGFRNGDECLDAEGIDFHAEYASIR